MNKNLQSKLKQISETFNDIQKKNMEVVPQHPHRRNIHVDCTGYILQLYRRTVWCDEREPDKPLALVR